jgi:hypothetical protein
MPGCQQGLEAAHMPIAIGEYTTQICVPILKSEMAVEAETSHESFICVEELLVQYGSNTALIDDVILGCKAIPG